MITEFGHYALLYRRKNVIDQPTTLYISACNNESIAETSNSLWIGMSNVRTAESGSGLMEWLDNRKTCFHPKFEFFSCLLFSWTSPTIKNYFKFSKKFLVVVLKLVWQFSSSIMELSTVIPGRKGSWFAKSDKAVSYYPLIHRTRPRYFYSRHYVT